MNDERNTTAGKLLAVIRQEAGLTQIELATRAKISRSMVAQIELGIRRPSRKVIHTLCQAMEATAEQEQELLLAYEFKPSGETPEQIAAFLRADKNLSPEAAEKIAKLVRQWYEKYTVEE